MKKILAIAIALVMLCACAITASAAETTLPDSDGNGWWVNHTPGVEITEDGVEIVFTNTTYETATLNWHGPLWVLYTGEEAKVMGAGYFEYWVGRGDAWGWGVRANYGFEDIVNDDGTVINTFDANSPDLMEQAGITKEQVYPVWDEYLATLKAGAECKVTAKIVDGKAVIVSEVAGCTTTTTIPVDTSKPVYVSLFAENATLTNIKAITPEADTPPVTGDMAGVVIAMMVASGAALVVLKKKEF